LAVLNRVVDKFVIVEARQTFSGVAKEPSFEIIERTYTSRIYTV